MLIETLVGAGVVLILAAVLLKRARMRRFALIGAVVSLIAAVVADPDILVSFADRVSIILDGEIPDSGPE
ncbi:MAG: hypothetical protein ABJE10_09915 [bacterium]